MEGVTRTRSGSTWELPKIREFLGGHTVHAVAGTANEPMASPVLNVTRRTLDFFSAAATKVKAAFKNEPLAKQSRFDRVVECVKEFFNKKRWPEVKKACQIRDAIVKEKDFDKAKTLLIKPENIAIKNSFLEFVKNDPEIASMLFDPPPEGGDIYKLREALDLGTPDDYRMFLATQLGESLRKREQTLDTQTSDANLLRSRANILAALREEQTLEEEIGKLESEKEVAQTEINTLQRSYEELSGSLQVKISEQPSREREVESSISQLQDSIEQKAREKSELQPRLAEKEGELNAARRAQSQLQKSPNEEDLRSEVASLEAQRAQLQQEIGAITTKINSPSTDRETLAQAKSKLAEEIANLSRDERDLSRKIELSSGEVAIFHRYDNDRRVASLGFGSLKEAVEVNNAHRQTLENLSARSQALENEMATLEREMAAVKQEIGTIDRQLGELVKNEPSLEAEEVQNLRKQAAVLTGQMNKIKRKGEPITEEDSKTLSALRKQLGSVEQQIGNVKNLGSTAKQSVQSEKAAREEKLLSLQDKYRKTKDRHQAMGEQIVQEVEQVDSITRLTSELIGEINKDFFREGGLKNIEEILQINGEKVQELSSQQKGIAEEIERKNNLIKAIDNLPKKTEELAALQGKIGERQKVLNRNLEFDALSGQISQISLEVDAIREKLRQNTEISSSLNASLTEKQIELMQIGRDISTAERHVSEAKASLEAAKAKMDGITLEVETRRSSLGNKKEECKTMGENLQTLYANGEIVDAVNGDNESWSSTDTINAQMLLQVLRDKNATELLAEQLAHLTGAGNIINAMSATRLEQQSAQEISLEPLVRKVLECICNECANPVLERTADNSEERAKGLAAARQQAVARISDLMVTFEERDGKLRESVATVHFSHFEDMLQNLSLTTELGIPDFGQTITKSHEARKILEEALALAQERTGQINKFLTNSSAPVHSAQNTLDPAR
ncbi:MAG: hypothetical protein LBJ94_01500 [Puniceicoccales bacterium]|jgi:chromosome segregation ATPase|nr:hypothetical protein [Puniceicoccales bacterium]